MKTYRAQLKSGPQVSRLLFLLLLLPLLPCFAYSIHATWSPPFSRAPCLVDPSPPSPRSGLQVDRLLVGQVKISAPIAANKHEGFVNKQGSQSLFLVEEEDHHVCPAQGRDIREAKFINSNPSCVKQQQTAVDPFS